jgi:hypothetical protein
LSKVTTVGEPFRPVLAIQDQSEVSPLSGRAKLEPLSDRLPIGIRFFRHPIPTRPRAHRCGWLSTLPVGTIGLTTFHTRTIPEGRRLRLPAGSASSARGNRTLPRPDCIPFGSCLSASLACCLSRRLSSGSLVLAVSFNPSSRPPRGWQSQRSLRVRLPADQAEATVSRALRTPGLPPAHGSVGVANCNHPTAEPQSSPISRPH